MPIRTGQPETVPVRSRVCRRGVDGRVRVGNIAVLDGLQCVDTRD